MGACMGVLGQVSRRPVSEQRLLLSLVAACPATSFPRAPEVAGPGGVSGVGPPAVWPLAGRDLCTAICSFLL